VNVEIGTEAVQFSEHINGISLQCKSCKDYRRRCVCSCKELRAGSSRSSERGGLVEEETVPAGLQGEAAVRALVVVVAGVRVRVHLQPCNTTVICSLSTVNGPIEMK
jgi:hypothetical protein